MTDNFKRITLKRARPNPLFEEWLEELYEETKAKNSKLQFAVKEALTSITKYPMPLQTGAECAILKGFGKKLCTFLDKKLEVHAWNSNNANEPRLESPCPSDSSENSLSCEPNEPEPDKMDVDALDMNIPKAKPLTLPSPIAKDFMPQYKSEDYAIITAMLNHMTCNTESESITKYDLLIKAQIHCKETFTSSKVELDHTHWKCLMKLINEGYIRTTVKNEIEFYLSKKGILLGSEMRGRYLNMIMSDSSREEAMLFNLQACFNTGETIDHLIPKVDVPVLHTAPIMEVVLQSDTYNIILIIDKKETCGVLNENDKTVIEFKKHPSIQYEYRHLNIGDFTWIAQHKVHKHQEIVLPYIVERKRMDDLGASIKDGRYHEQKFRLKRCGIKNVIYLIEKFGKNEHVGLPLQTLMQALANTRVQDGFKVHFTDSLTATVNFLDYVTTKIIMLNGTKTLVGKNRKPCENDELMLFSYFNSTNVKCKAITVKEAFIKMLLQLKGVSVDKALAITDVYQSPKALTFAYLSRTVEDGEMLLSDIKFGSGSKKIGAHISKIVYQLFTKEKL